MWRVRRYCCVVIIFWLFFLLYLFHSTKKRDLSTASCKKNKIYHIILRVRRQRKYWSCWHLSHWILETLYCSNERSLERRIREAQCSIIGTLVHKFQIFWMGIFPSGFEPIMRFFLSCVISCWLHMWTLTHLRKFLGRCCRRVWAL